LDEGAVSAEDDFPFRDIHKSKELRNTRRVYGDGQRVAVVSRDAQHLQDSQTFDLPFFVDVGPAGVGQGDEGTATLEVVHDVAPHAALAFYHLPNFSEYEIANAITTARFQGATVIVDNFSSSAEPLFQVGPIAQERRYAIQGSGPGPERGAFYVVSAGNVAKQH
jgi:hypothetical protein